MQLSKIITAIHEFFRAPTLTEVISEEMERAVLEKNQASHVIRTHEFIKHMARAKSTHLMNGMNNHE